MLARMDTMVQDALKDGHAVPAFTCYDFTTALAVVEVAERLGRAVILNVAPKTAGNPSGLRLVSALRQLAEQATVPVAVQLDHATDAELITEAVKAGANAVLADGSASDFEQNIAFVQQIRGLLGPEMVIEAELGALAGNEDQAFEQSAAGLTDPGQVAGFVQRSGADLLAVAIGNVHGRYKGEPKIHWDVLETIHRVCPIPLVLHGASGIAAADLSRSIGLGVGKVNLNTELRTAVLKTVEHQIADRRAEGQNLLGLLGDWDEAVQAIATETFTSLRTSVA
ncbi:class II fructose-bisphosphate aldolase [Glutamicibacter sp. MNS18]|uniref:class II fructose-bisphosphate aldolase n=1 Tax=Glutamicibacter sp. MNS18 TaxID=2989817 RepID=UPI002235F636|nr:class II fructose-bisphosphate aldolase [Glutamicibacter sp. MNS18]MCW4465397.1 class II fructose-bisphosphate aldolase [Glutamicibacter sp. MNS18]